MKNLILKLIKLYQIFISPGLGADCRFYPSCSDYMILAIKKYGTFSGLAKGIWRILRCNHLSKGGVELP